MKINRPNTSQQGCRFFSVPCCAAFDGNIKKIHVLDASYVIVKRSWCKKNRSVWGKSIQQNWNRPQHWNWTFTPIANSYVWFLRPKCDVSPYLCLKWSQRVAPEHNNKKNNLDVSCLAYFSSGFCKLYRPKFGIKRKFILVVPPCILNRQSARTHRKCPAQHWTQQVQCNNSFFYVWNMAAPSSWLIIT